MLPPGAGLRWPAARAEVGGALPDPAEAGQRLVQCRSSAWREEEEGRNQMGWSGAEKHLPNYSRCRCFYLLDGGRLSSRCFYISRRSLCGANYSRWLLHFAHFQGTFSVVGLCLDPFCIHWLASQRSVSPRSNKIGCGFVPSFGFEAPRSNENDNTPGLTRSNLCSTILWHTAYF